MHVEEKKQCQTTCGGIVNHSPMAHTVERSRTPAHVRRSELVPCQNANSICIPSLNIEKDKRFWKINSSLLKDLEYMYVNVQYQQAILVYKSLNSLAPPYICIWRGCSSMLKTVAVAGQTLGRLLITSSLSLGLSTKLFVLLEWNHCSYHVMGLKSIS